MNTFLHRQRRLGAPFKPSVGLSGIPQHSTCCFFCPSNLTTPNKSHPPSPLSSDRSEPGFPATRPSPTPTCALSVKESRMKLTDATNPNRKSGVAKPRDLLFHFRAQRRYVGE
jgi:hypothetical protein